MADDRVGTGSVVLPKTYVQSVRKVLTLPDDKLKAVNTWAKSHLTEVVRMDPDIAGVAERLGMEENEFLLAFSVMNYYVLALGSKEAPDLNNFIQSLSSQGLGDLARKAEILLDGIHVDPSQGEYARQRTFATQFVLPTLNRVDAVCDLRGVFRDFPSPDVSKSHVERRNTLLGFEAIVIISITVNDTAGKDHVTVFQCTERDILNIVNTLQQAAEQMKRLGAKKPL